LPVFIRAPGHEHLHTCLVDQVPPRHLPEQQAAVIERYFSALDKVDYPFISTEIETDNERLAVGADLFAKLQCQSCHPTSNALPPGKAPEDLAPNLQLAHERLRPDWVLQWVRDPQKIFPGTRMPTFFP